MTQPLRFVTKAEAIKEEYKGRTNYWLTRPELTGAKTCRSAKRPCLRAKATPSTPTPNSRR